MGRTGRIAAAEHYARGPSDEVPETVRIWLLGGFRTSVGHKAIEEGQWRLRKAAKLIQLLALAPNHRVHRERAMDLLWPDLDPKAAANNLRHALHGARRTLEPSAVTASPRYLVLGGELLELCPDVPLWVDVEAFERAAESARRAREPAAYRAALGLYAGELLPQDRYEEWAEEKREGLRGTYLALLLELAKLYEERGSAREAIEALRRAVAAEPAGEEAHARLMRQYAPSGRSGEALGHSTSGFEKPFPGSSVPSPAWPAAVSAKRYSRDGFSPPSCRERTDHRKSPGRGEAQPAGPEEQLRWARERDGRGPGSRKRSKVPCLPSDRGFIRGPAPGLAPKPGYLKYHKTHNKFVDPPYAAALACTLAVAAWAIANL